MGAGALRANLRHFRRAKAAREGELKTCRLPLGHERRVPNVPQTLRALQHRLHRPMRPPQSSRHAALPRNLDRVVRYSSTVLLRFFIFPSFPQILIAGKETSRCRLLARKRTVDALTAQNRWAQGGQLRFSDEVYFPVACRLAALELRHPPLRHRFHAFFEIVGLTQACLLAEFVFGRPAHPVGKIATHRRAGGE